MADDITPTSGTSPQANGRILPRVIEDEMKQAYLAYSMSVIVGRALPDARDGLKPVHRRLLYSMHELGLLHNKPFRKSAKIVGEVMGNYHPHGDAAIYETLVRMAQDFSLRYPLIDGQGNFGCFTKDTIVRLADGRDLSFGQLVEEHSNGKRNFTFTIKDDGDITIAEIKNPRFTKHNAALVKITLDNGAEIKCTPDHKFMLLDGAYRQAQQLEPGTSLMPGYFRVSQKEANSQMEGYELIFNHKTKSWEYCHTLADTWNIENEIYARSTGRVRHHVDFDKRNNNPTNILRMHWGEHFKLHSSHASQLHLSQQYREKIAAGRRQYWSGKKVRQKYALRISEQNRKCWKNPEYREKMRKFLSRANKEHIKRHPELRKEFSRRASATLKRMWKDPKYRKLFNEKITASNKRRVTNNTGKVKFLRICHDSLADHQALNEGFYELTRITKFGKGFTTWEKGIKKYFNNDFNALSAELCQNHKVVRVENISGTADVYDLTIDGTHNFLLSAGVFVHNSVDGDGAAAMRYTEARLSRIAEEILADIQKETVSFQDNYDGSRQEPMVLPSKIPNLLINGTAGIAVGMATNIPPHNINEICNAAMHLISNPEAKSQELLKFVQAPDFPTGGIILGKSGVINAYKTGRGKITLRARTEIEESKNRQRLIVTELPYQVNKAELIEEIANFVRDRKIQGISDLRDESDRQGMRIVIELKQGSNSEVVRNQLFSHTRMQTTFGIIQLALVDNQPKILTLSELLGHFIDHRLEMVRKRTAFDLNEAEEKSHILAGLIIALDDLENVIELIKKSKSGPEAKLELVRVHNLSEIQAQAILDMKLQRLTGLEQEKIRQEQQELIVTIADLKDILAKDKRVRDIVAAELGELKTNYGDERKTQIIDAEETTMEEEQLIKPEDVVVTVTREGYVKRLPVDTYKSQKRGGKGIIATGTKQEDFVQDLFIANTRSSILFFTNKGKVHWLKVYQIPEAGRTARGTPVVNLIELAEGEKASTLIPVREFEEDKFVFFATKKGIVKKTSLAEFSRPRKGGILAIGSPEDDNLMSALLTDGKKDIIIATSNGMAIRFSEKDVRPMGRTAYGVTGIKLREGDKVIGAVIAEDEKDLLSLTKFGYGKRTSQKEYRKIGRAGVGVINFNITEKTGPVVEVKTVLEEDEVMIISRSGIIIRTEVRQISLMGRSTQGVRVMRMKDNDEVTGVEKIVAENGEE